MTAHPGPEPVPLTAATISVTELNHATATVLSRVEQGEQGEHLTVTHRGQVIASTPPPCWRWCSGNGGDGRWRAGSTRTGAGWC